MHDRHVERTHRRRIVLQSRVPSRGVEQMTFELDTLRERFPPTLLAAVVHEAQQQLLVGLGDDAVDPHQLPDIGNLRNPLARLESRDLRGGARHLLGHLVEGQPGPVAQPAQLGSQPATRADGTLRSGHVTSRSRTDVGACG